MADIIPSMKQCVAILAFVSVLQGECGTARATELVKGGINFTATVERDRGGYPAWLTITMQNPGPGYACVDWLSAVQHRFYARTRRGEIAKVHKIFLRPPPGCEELAGGSTLTWRHDLYYVYNADPALRDAEFCVEIVWRWGRNDLSDQPYTDEVKLCTR